MPWKGLLQWLGMHLDKEMRLFYIQATLLEDLVNCLQSLYFSVLYMFKDLKACKMSLMAVNSSYGRLVSSSLPICLNTMVTMYCLFCKVLHCG